MELGVHLWRRRRHRGPVSEGCSRLGSPIPAPFLLGPGRAAALEGAGAGAGQTPQLRGQVKLLHRAGRALARSGGRRGPLRAAAQLRALPRSPTASFLPAPASTAASCRLDAARWPF